MGVPGFFSWLLRNKKKLSTNKLIIEQIEQKIKYLMLDTNCLLHPCVANILDKYKNNQIKLDDTKSIRLQLEELIWNKIEFTINDMIDRLKPEYIYIAIDGVAPMGKILQQRQRRYKYLFDTQIKLHSDIINNKQEVILDNELPSSSIQIERIDENSIEIPKLPLSSIELTPGTDYMERIHLSMLAYVKKLDKQNIKYIYSSYHTEGEGEHKILQYIKHNVKPEDIVVVYGLDADLLFLSLAVGDTYNLYVMREQQVFNNTPLDMDDFIDYNYVEINKLRGMISKLEINTNDFIICCYLVGNDFLPGILTTDIKKGGLDKILSAYANVQNKIGKNKSIINIDGNKIITINHDFIKELFIELLWTERYVWKNMNRNRDDKSDVQVDKIEYENKKKVNQMENLNKFISGETANIDCLEKIPFSSGTEYYNYYLGTEDDNIDKNIIKYMVKNYITGMEWCINYYLSDCKSWKWGYNYMIAPLICDIVKYYPKKIFLEKTECELKPIEQLILAIPPETYKYVLAKNIVNTIKSRKEIGYMFPESFDIDINKESIYWKCQVKIPIVEYEEYITIIKLIGISDEKNISTKIITNY
jgi:5'-3' exonuclease